VAVRECCNWLKVESLVRDLAKQLKDSLLTYTGYFDLLYITDPADSTRSLPIYLNYSDYSLPVPKYTFKVVLQKTRNAAIVFITENNPNVNNTTNVSDVCPNICKEANFNDPDFAKIENGIRFVAP